MRSICFLLSASYADLFFPFSAGSRSFKSGAVSPLSQVSSCSGGLDENVLDRLFPSPQSTNRSSSVSPVSTPRRQAGYRESTRSPTCSQREYALSPCRCEPRSPRLSRFFRRSLICVFTLDRIGRRVTLFWGKFLHGLGFAVLLSRERLLIALHSAQAALSKLSRSSWRAFSSTCSQSTPKRRLSTEVLLLRWCSWYVKIFLIADLAGRVADAVFLQYTATFGATCKKSRHFLFKRNRPDLCSVPSSQKGSPYPGSTP